MNQTLTTSAKPVEQIIAMLDKAYAIRGSFTQDSIELSREALLKSRELEDDRLISRSLSVLSLCLMITGDYSESMEYAEEAINIFEELEDEKGVADAKYTIAGIYYKTDNPNIGLIFLKECLETYQKIEDYHCLSKVYKSMGAIFEYFDDHKSAINAYEHSIEAGIVSGDPNLESNAYSPLSGIYLNTGHVNKAMELIEKAISMKQQTGDRRGLGYALYGRGKVYSKLERYEEAEADFMQALDIHLSYKDQIGLGMTYNKLASLYIETDALEKAKNIVRDRIQLSNKGSKIKLLSAKYYHLLYRIAKKEADHAAALDYLEKHYYEKESVINSRTLKVIESYDTIHKMRDLEGEAETQKIKAAIIQKKNLELDSIFYRIAHDLKVPINALKRAEYLLLKDAKNEKSKTIVGDIGKGVKSIERILDELIRISRVNHLSDIKEEIHFEKLIRESINAFKYLVKFDEVKIMYEIEEGAYLKAEWALVNAVLQNLLQNAIKFADVSKPSPYVQINIWKESEDGVLMEVIDNGIGIEKEQQETIMDMFFRPNKTIKNPGMGLFMIYRAVENLKARVTFESKPGKGTKFSISIPSSA